MLEGTGFDYNTEQENSHFLVEAIIKPSDKFKQKFETQIPKPDDPIMNSTPSEYSRDKTSNFSDVSIQEELNFAIIRRFEFSSRLQRMSVITRSLVDTKFRIFAKGSPEKIKELSLPESIPANFHDVLTSYTQNGLRVLGMACKILPDMSYEKLQSKTRDFFENDLVFCGFLIMENMLKPETKGVIDELNDCGFKSVMITGDNALTGISVARKCGIVNGTSRVFLGDIDEDNADVINWQDIDSQERLNRYTLNQSNSAKIKADDESLKEYERLYEESQMIENESYQRGIESKPSKPNLFSFDFIGLRKNSNARSEVVALPYGGENHTKVGIQRKFSEIPLQAPTEAARRLSNDAHKKTVGFKPDIPSRKYSRIDPYEYPWGVSDSGDYVIAISGRAFKQFISDRLEIATRATGVSPTMAKLIETDKVLKLFLMKCLVYARMKPDQKSEAVSYIQDLYSKERILVGFCGDGANDCGALKTAHVGVSLSLSEASVAAPFTSNITNISSVIFICAEGRSALTTSFQSFKYLCYYSILQCFGLILLYFVGIDYSFIMYIVNDLMIVFPLSLFMCYHGPYKKLSSFLPGDSLLSFPVLLSVFGQLVIGCIFVYYGQVLIKYDPNYQDTATISALNAGSWEPDNTTFWDGAATYYTTSI